MRNALNGVSRRENWSIHTALIKKSPAMGGLSSTGFSSKCDYFARVPAIVIVIRTNVVVLLSALTLPKGLFSVLRSTTDSSPMSPPTPRHAQSFMSTSEIYLTIRTDDGTNPASFRVLEKSTSPSKVLRGNVVVKLDTAFPVSLCSCCASSNSVVSAGRALVMFPPSVCSRSRASLWLLLGLDAAATAAAPPGVAAST